MSIASRIQQIEGHIGDIYDTLELGGDSTQNKNIVNIDTEIKREYKDFLANGTDTLWNNWEKVSGSGTSLTLNNTIKGKMEIEYGGNTSQEGTPTPDSPIPINVVSGDNTLEVVGKNLFDISKSVQGSINSSGVYSSGGVSSFTITGNSVEITTTQVYRGLVSDYIEVVPNNNYTLSYDKPTTSVTYFGYYYWYDENKTFIQRQNISTPNRTAPANAKYCIITIGINEIGTFTISNIQIEYGSTATTYEPYQSQTYPINLGTTELCKIGTYQDRIYYDNGKWYLKKEIGKVVLDGTENWGTYNIGNFIMFFITNITDYLKQENLVNGYSNYYKVFRETTNSSDFTNVLSSTDYGISFGSGTTTIRIKDTRFNNQYATDLKNWLSSNNVEVIYVLATPTYETITDTTLLSQLEAIKYSYDNQTSISQVNNDLPFELDVVALKELL